MITKGNIAYIVVATVARIIIVIVSIRIVAIVCAAINTVVRIMFSYWYMRVTCNASVLVSMAMRAMATTSDSNVLLNKWGRRLVDMMASIVERHIPPMGCCLRIAGYGLVDMRACTIHCVYLTNALLSLPIVLVEAMG